MKQSILFKEIVNLWKIDKRQYVKKSTYAAYSLLIQNHIVPKFGSMTEIKESDLQEFVNEKLRLGLSVKSVKDILIVCKMIIRFGVKHNYLTHNQYDIHFPTTKVKQEIEVLSIVNQRALMKYVKEHFTFLNLGILICLCSGIRIGELCALKWEDLDIQTEIITINKTIQRIYIVDDGEKHTELLIDFPKTKNSNRQIPLTKELIAMLKPLRKIVRSDYYVLTNNINPCEPRTYRTYFNKLLKSLGLPQMKFHGLRHSFATRCIESKCDYKTVSVLLGHSNIGTTLNLYVHPNLEQKKKCVAQMSKMLK